MATKAESIFVGALRADKASRASIVQGSIKAKCSDCQREVWIAPSSQKILKQDGARLICVECAGERMANDTEVEVNAPTPEQKREIIEHLRRN